RCKRSSPLNVLAEESGKYTEMVGLPTGVRTEAVDLDGRTGLVVAGDLPERQADVVVVQRRAGAVPIRRDCLQELATVRQQLVAGRLAGAAHRLLAVLLEAGDQHVAMVAAGQIDEA